MPSSKNDTDLINDARNGNLKEFRDLLQKGANVNAKDIHGNTALMWACCNRRVDVALEILTRDNVNVNVKNKNGDTALILACNQSLSEVSLKILTRDNVDVNVKNSEGLTALYLACFQSLSEVSLKILSRDNVDVNVKNGNGLTALYLACYRKLSDVALEILKRDNVDVNVKNSDGQTALYWANQNDLGEVVRALLQHSKVVKEDRAKLLGLMNSTSNDDGPVELSLEFIRQCTFLRKLGRPGAFGEVSLRQDSHLPKKFAIKTIKLDKSDQESIDEARKTFQHDMSRLKRARQRNIGVLYGYNLNVNHTDQFLVYEYAANGSLDGFFRDDGNRARLPANIRLSIMFELARAVHFLHTGGCEGWKVYHRDIMSANICIAEDFTVRLIDCGLAKFVPDENSNNVPGSVTPSVMSANKGPAFGTPEYICPEYYGKKHEGTPCPFIAAFDVFSIGVVMVELILGCLTGGKSTRNGVQFDNAFRRFVKNENTLVADGWKLLERDADPSITWKPDSLQLVCTTAIGCITPASQGRLSTKELLPLLSKAINLQAGISYPEPEGAGNGSPCAVCNLPHDGVTCSRESHAMCSSCIEQELLKGPPHTPGRQLPCLIDGCLSQPFTEADLGRYIHPNVFTYCFVKPELKKINRRQKRLASIIDSCLPGWAKLNANADQLKLCPNLMVLTPSAVDGLKNCFMAMKGKKKYKVFFLCANSFQQGHEPFEITVDRKWVVRVAPWLRVVLKILEAVARPSIAKEMKTLIDELWDEEKQDDDQTLQLQGDALKAIAAKAKKEKNRQFWEEKVFPVVNENGRTIWVKEEYKQLYGV